MNDEPKMQVLQFEIPHLASRQRLDSYVTKHVKYATRNRVQQAIQEKRVLVNGAPAKNSYGLLPGDLVEVTLERPAPEDMIAQPMDLDILYEDDEIIVVNKPPGLPVHPTYKHWDNTLANGLLYHFRQQVGDPEAKFKPGLIHRLDKHTSGVLVVGKSAIAKRVLGKQFKHRQTTKVYHALVWGCPENPEDVLETNLGTAPKSKLLQQVYPLYGSQGRPSKTGYEVVEQCGPLSLLKVRLYTGRTHQIRVHLQHIGHPIVGDFLYGGLDGLGQYTQDWVPELLERMPRQALHAGHLEIFHPLTEEPMTFEADIPEDIKGALKWARGLNHEPI